MNAHHIRLAALDMDGTLLREDKTLSAYTLRVLGCMADRGVILVPATGRVREGLTENILTLPSISYAICANGAYIEDIKKNQVLASWPLERKQAVQISEYLRNFPVCFYIHTDQGTFRQSSLDRGWLRAHYPFLNFQEDSFCDLGQLLREREVLPLKIGILIPDEQLFRRLLNAPLPVEGLRVMRTGPENIEINADMASKGAALRWLCRYLDIPLSQTLAIGDNQNDLEMIEAAAVSAAMENGLEEVRQKAGFICPGNQEDGAARFLAEYFELKDLI